MKISKVLIYSAPLLLPLQFAHAQQPSINAQIAATDISSYNTGLVLMVGYEHPIPALHENISVEGELATTVMNPERTYSIAGFGYADELSYYTVSAYVKYTHPINDQFSVYGRAGVHYEDISYSDGFFNSTVSDTGVGRNLGIGADYQLNPNMAFTVGATLIDTDGSNFNSDIKHISAGVKFKL